MGSLARVHERATARDTGYDPSLAHAIDAFVAAVAPQPGVLPVTCAAPISPLLAELAPAWRVCSSSRCRVVFVVGAGVGCGEAGREAGREVRRAGPAAAAAAPAIAEEE
jgi:hypothetical protein